jgi:hypothetical protein
MLSMAALQGELDHASKQLKAATARFSAALDVRYGILDHAAGQPPRSAQLGLGPFLDHTHRNVTTIAPRALLGVMRDHRHAGFGEDQPAQQRR